MDSQRFPENLKESQRKAKMGMDVRAIKHAAKLAEWSEKIQACRSSGMTVKEWCEQNHVCSKTYYTWERVYLAEVSRRLAIPERLSEQVGRLVRIDPRNDIAIHCQRHEMWLSLQPLNNPHLPMSSKS